MENDLICRICLCDKDLVAIFDASNTNPICVKIMSCAAVDVRLNDNLPSKICSQCLVKLETSFQFKNQCEESDAKLRNQISLNVHKDIPNACEEMLETSEEKIIKGKRRKKCTRKEIEGKVKKNKVEIIVESISKAKATVNNMESSSEISFKGEDVINDEEFTDDENEDFDYELSPNGSQDERRQNYKTNDKKQSKEQCSTCGKVMSTRFRLRMHMRTHTGERPHCCSVCGRSFTLAQSLKVHLRTHSGEKPLVCAVCGRAFAQYSGLAAHSRLHTGVMPYHCYICGENFRTTGHLQYHTRKHTGEKKFECDICHRAFIMRADLTQHLKIHSGEKRYVCVLCGMRMTRSSHLTRHMLTHSKEKTHVCTVCGATFSQKSDRVKHEKKHCPENNGVKSGCIKVTKLGKDLNTNIPKDSSHEQK